MIRKIFAFIFLITTLFVFIALVFSLNLLFTIPLTPGETYGPLGISNPPLVMVIVFGLAFLVLLVVTIKLFKS